MALKGKESLMKLLPLPKPDGAPLVCSVEYATRVWPYTHKCNNPAKGLLTEEDYQELKADGYPAMRAVCSEHFEEIREMLNTLYPLSY